MSATARVVVLTVLAGLVLATAASAATVTLNAVQFPEKRTVKLAMSRTAAAPRAELAAEVRYENGQAGIELKYTAMKPAVLFAGDVTCYVAWAVTRDGAAENLGELVVRDIDGDVTMSTGQKAFALLVTAEPYFLVGKPSELVIFTSAPSTDKKAPSSQFRYSGFDPAPAHGMDTISMVAYDSTIPPELLQARKALELADRLGAAELAEVFFLDASGALGKANEFAQRNPRSKNTFDFARRSIQASNEAIRKSAKILADKKAAEEAAARSAEMAQLSFEATEAQAQAAAAATEAERQRAEAERQQAEARRQQAEADQQRAAAQSALTELDRQRAEAERQRAAAQSALTELDRQRAEMNVNLTAMRAEREKLAAEMEMLHKEKLGLKNRLQDALSKVASTESSARGYIVNLPDILFDVNQATLKAEAKVAIAKLAGILLVMPDLNLRVEGHTDSTGSFEHNQTLSEQRAMSVVSFVAEQGVEVARMVSAGYGPTRPVADNTSADGRKKNRRVEIVVGEGQIQEAAAP